MKKSSFTDAHVAFILRQAEDGTAIGEVCRKAGISEATFYNWRKKYAGLDAIGDEAAEPARRRTLVDDVRASWKVSIRRAARCSGRRRRPTITKANVTRRPG
jgi:AcrR family transcriptional regulator